MRKLLCMLALCAAAAGGLRLLAADPESPPGVTRVTVHAEGESLSSVLENISQQAHVRVTVDAAQGQTPITLRAEDKPLWETVMAALYPVNNDGAFSFALDGGTGTATRYSGKTYASGAFLVVANSITHQADFRRADGDADQFYVGIQLAIDPAVTALFVEGDNVPAVATDDAGVSLVPAGAREPRPVPLRSQQIGPVRAQPARIVLSRPATPAQLGKKLAKLEGEIPVTIATKTEKIELNIGGKADRVINGARGSFECKLQDNGSVQISAHFDRPDGISDDQWNELDKRLFCTKLSILDANGVAITYTGGSSASYGPKVRSMSQTFSTNRNPPGRAGAGPAPVAPAKGVVEVMTEVQVVKAAYRFGDLALP